MRQLLFALVMGMVLIHTTVAQTSGGFNYQAILRDDVGEPLGNTSISIKFILINDQGTQWEETHDLTTSAFGLVTAIVGGGTVIGGSAASFDAIDWSSSNLSLQVEVDRGEGFVRLGTTLLQSVPYAKHAENGLSETEAAKLAAIPDNAAANVQADWTQSDANADDFIKNKPSIPLDINELNDANNLLSGSTFDGSFENLTDVPANLDTDATDDFSGSFVDLSDVPESLKDGDDVNDADADPANEIQDLSMKDKVLTITGNDQATAIDLSVIDTDTNTDEQDLQYENQVITLSGDPDATRIDLSAFDTNASDDFDGSYNSLTDVPANLDTDASDDFDGSYNSLTDVPANLDTDATDDFSGSFNDLTDVPARLDTDASDDFDGSYNSLTDVPANLDTDATDDFSGSFNDLTDVPANLDTDASDDFDGSYNSLKDVPANLDTDATDDFSGSFNDLTDVPARLDTDASDDFDGSYNSLTDVPANLDTDATDDFSGSFNDLTDVPARLDTDASDDFDGSYNSLTDVPANLDTDATDDFSGSFNDLMDVPINLDIDVSDDFSGDYNDLTNQPNIISDVSELTDDQLLLFNGQFSSLSDVPFGLSDGDDVVIQDLAIDEGALFITGNDGATMIPIERFWDEDTDPGNEIQDLVLIDNELSVTKNDDRTAIDLTPYTRDEQNLDFAGGILSLSGDPDGTLVDLSMYDTDVSDDFDGDYNKLTNKPTIISSLATHSVTELDDVTDAGSGQIITDEERILLNNWEGSDAFGITSTAIDNWNDAHGWGDHGQYDYAVETDFAALASVQGLTAAQIARWETAEGYFDETDAPLASSIGATEINNWNSTASIVTSNSTDWNAAFGWGDHAQAGYVSAAGITDLTAIQGIQAADVTSWNAATALVNTNQANWSAAYAFFDGADLPSNGSLNANDITSWNSTANTVSTNSTNWDASFGWGDHGAAGYLLEADQIITKTANLISFGQSGEDFVFGSSQLDKLPGENQGDDARVFFDRSKGAFRAGVASGDQWDDANVGDFSVVVGGAGNKASGLQTAVVGGLFNTATAERSIAAGGFTNNATGDYAGVYGGLLNNATGNRATVLGGESNTASGGFSTVAGGFSNSALASFSSASGISNTANAYAETVIGHYATVGASQNAAGITVTDRLFVVGNGLNSDNRSDALTIFKNGNVEVSGAVKVSAAIDDNNPSAPAVESHVMVIENTSELNNSASVPNPSSMDINSVQAVNANSNNGLAINLNVPQWQLDTENHFITFYRDANNIAGRIEGEHTADFLQFRQLVESSISGVPELANGLANGIFGLMDLNLSYNPSWFTFYQGNWPSDVLSGGQLPNLDITFGSLPSATFNPGSLPTISPRYVSVLGIDVIEGWDFYPGALPSLSFNPGLLTGFNFHHGQLPTFDPSKISTPSFTVNGSPFTVGDPIISLDGTVESIMINTLTALGGGLSGFGASALDAYDCFTDGTRCAIDQAVVLANTLSTGGVTYQSGSGDYAEWLEMANETDVLAPGTVIGVKGGKISKNTRDADHVMVISVDPIVLGNTPDKTREEYFRKVAFMGQVPVRTFGAVKKGDILIASGRNDGEAIGIAPDKITPEQITRVVGVAWTDAYNEWGVSYVKACVGLKNAEIGNLMQRIDDRLDQLEKQNQLLTEANQLLHKQQTLNNQQFADLEAKLNQILGVSIHQTTAKLDKG